MTPMVQLQRLPRMADFAIWAVAAERGRDEPAEFMAAFARARMTGHEQALEASVIGSALLAFIADDLAREPWQGTAKDLLARLAALGGEAATRQKEWPKSPRGLSGMLRGLAPALRAVGVTVTFDLKEGKKRTRLMRLERTDTHPPQDGGIRPSASSAPSAEDRPTGWPDRPEGGRFDPSGGRLGTMADGQADGCSGEADGADGCAAAVSVGVGGMPVRRVGGGLAWDRPSFSPS